MKVNKNSDEMERKELNLRKQDTAMKRLAERQALNVFYPTNLPYLTMQRIYGEKAKSAKQTRWIEGIAVGLMVVMSVIVIFVFCGEAMNKMLDFFVKSFSTYSMDMSSLSILKYALLTFGYVFFVSLNALLNHHFGKKE